MPRLPFTPDSAVQLVAGVAVAPVSLVRQGSVVLARTTRNWELTLERLAGRPVDGDAPRPTHAASVVEDLLADNAASPADVSTGTAAADAPNAAQEDATTEPPVEGWAEMSPQAATAALADLDVDGLDALLAYEQAHGRRTAYLLMLRQRREAAASA